VSCTVTIEGIAAGGDGVGHLDDGMVVFVPRSAPGDTLSIEIKGRKPRFARGRISAVLEAGPNRVDSTCPHYDGDECGGCQLQHIAAEAQRDAKRRIVGDALRRIAKLSVADPEIVASPQQWRYRGKVTLAHKGGRVGFRLYDRPEEAFDLHDCLLAQDRVMSLWESVRRCRKLLPDEFESLVLRLDCTGGRHVVAIGGKSIWDARPLAAAVGDDDTSYWWKPEKGAARVVAGPETGYPAVAFEQMNTVLAKTIRETAADWFGDLDDKVAWDLYGGVGDTAEILANRGARVWSVDVDRSAVEWGQKRSTGAGGLGVAVTRLVDRVEEGVARLPKPDLVVVNPPRAGLGSRLTGWLQRWGEGGKGARMVYISCDPATLARDLLRMPSFTLTDLIAYDLFPQTGHVETLTFLEAA
jgi:23S rRNA (uracil1939-C5)-methyltransferase